MAARLYGRSGVKMPSNRLEAIVKITPGSGTIADIGCDHGKTAYMLLNAGKAKRVICTDISAKSLEKARRLLSSKALNESASFRSGDGFMVIEKGEADTAILSGMGGDLIARLLEEGKDRLPETLVLSCNTKPEAVRRWLNTNGYRIEDEDMVHEGSHFYPVILAKKGKAPFMEAAEFELGPVLMNKKPETFIEFVEKRIIKINEKREKIMKSRPKDFENLIAELDIKQKKYEEVIKCL